MRPTTRRRLGRGATAAAAIIALTAGVAPTGAGAKPDDRAEVAEKKADTTKKTGAKPDDDFRLAVAFDYGYSKVPSRLDTGTYDFTFENRSTHETHEIVFFKLRPEDKDSTVEDVIAAAGAGAENEEEESPFFSDFRGVSFAEPLSEQHTEEFEPGFVVGRADLSDPGRYLYICFIPNEDGIPHYKLDPGMIGFINVK